MSEITSFNELFSEAARLRLHLNSFHQMPDGVFVANWRKKLSGAHAQFFPVVRSDKPFVAARDALLLAMGDGSKPTDEAPVAPKGFFD